MFLAVVVIFFYEINILGNSTDDRKKDNLEKALNNSIIYCYAIEGSYPESLEYICLLYTSRCV